jgi:hypothetical protein
MYVEYAVCGDGRMKDWDEERRGISISIPTPTSNMVIEVPKYKVIIL